MRPQRYSNMAANNAYKPNIFRFFPFVNNGVIPGWVRLAQVGASSLETAWSGRFGLESVKGLTGVFVEEESQQPHIPGMVRVK